MSAKIKKNIYEIYSYKEKKKFNEFQSYLSSLRLVYINKCVYLLPIIIIKKKTNQNLKGVGALILL